MLIDVDSYYRSLDDLPPDQRERVNFDHPDMIDFPLLIAQLRQLLAGHTIEKPVYDFAAHTRAPRTEHVEPREIIVVEGILSFSSPVLRDLFDLESVRGRARSAPSGAAAQPRRDGTGRTVESVRTQYEATVRPMHREFVEPGKAFADLVVHDAASPMKAARPCWPAPGASWQPVGLASRRNPLLAKGLH